MARPARRPERGTRGRRLVALAATASAAACVRVDPAPNGIASVRLDFAPPAIALGDSLRDTLGVALRVRGVAYDVAGNVVPTATFRYSYLPTTPDTAVGAVIDTALLVDSATGAVRAATAWLKLGNGTGIGISSGRVLARIGSTLQLADTLQIVPRPDSVVVTAPADTVLRYDCRDDRTTAVQSDTVLRIRNTAGPFTVTVRGDSVGMRVNVRRWLVRWTVDSVPKSPVPSAKLTSTASVPAIAVIANGSDQVIGYDTTDASGASNVRLRIRPTALGPSYADTTFRVVLRADVIVGAGRPVRASPVRGVFAVRLSRVPTTACPQ